MKSNFPLDPTKFFTEVHGTDHIMDNIFRRLDMADCANLAKASGSGKANLELNQREARVKALARLAIRKQRKKLKAKTLDILKRYRILNVWATQGNGNHYLWLSLYDDAAKKKWREVYQTRGSFGALITRGGLDPKTFMFTREVPTGMYFEVYKEQSIVMVCTEGFFYLLK